MRRWPAGLVCAGLLFPACQGADADLAPALDTISASDIAGHVQVLAADSFEGRAPSSAGEQKTITYVRSAFQRLGLKPGNGQSYFQEVPLIALAADHKMTLSVRGRGRSAALRYGPEFVGFTDREARRVDLQNSELVYVGYGVNAPEYGWNDYAGVDVRGKTVVVLVNDPGFATGDTSTFKGKTMTYYGRWTYKYEEAARQGAAGCLIIHETAAAGYPWEVVSGSWGSERFLLPGDPTGVARLALEGWVTLDAARRLFAQAGLDYDSLKTGAARHGFTARPLGLTASVTIHNSVRRSTSNNVIGVLPGKSRPDEYVMYMAHWDHLGRDSTLQGDQIYNGALDNASGTAGLLALAKAFASVRQGTERSIVFLSVTAEEQGLLGSQYYAAHPVYPLTKTVAAINMDGLNIWGRMRDITIIGYGNSELDDYVTAAAREQNRVVRPDAEPEKGFYYRSDHFSLAKAGVPALDPDAGIDNMEHGDAWARQQRDAYTAERYHKPADEYDPTWDLSGAVQDLRLFFRVGYRLANETTFPSWRDGTEFKAKRDSMMAGLS